MFILLKKKEVLMFATMEHFLLWWTFYSFIGWIWETGVGVFTQGRFIDRDVLNGPLCPVYGFGCILIVVLLDDVINPLALFLASGFIACLLEYVTSVVVWNVVSMCVCGITVINLLM